MTKEAEERMNKSFELDTTTPETQEAAQIGGTPAINVAPPAVSPGNIPQVIVPPGSGPQTAPR
jgi:hypothetical protein